MTLFGATANVMESALLPKWQHECMSSYPARRSLRLAGYDYAQAGAYFVTLCTDQRRPLLGTVTEGTMSLSPIGTLVADNWASLGAHFPTVENDTFAVLPNHLHGIILLAEPPAGQQSQTLISLSELIRRFKTFTATRYRKLHLGPPESSLWQRNFYERVIRDERELDKIRSYIATNVQSWLLQDADFLRLLLEEFSFTAHAERE